MAFSKHDLDAIKSKISLSREIEKKTKVIKKGKDAWCCCLFHDEKTPSLKINDDLGSYYCFGCGAKGDIFSLYTDLYNYSFLDAVKELGQKAGVNINFHDNQNSSQYNNINKILELSTKWFEDNLHDFSENVCQKYLQARKLKLDTIKSFRLGYSYNPKTSLYKFLKNYSFQDEELLKSNIVKYDHNNKIRDFFYKRLMFPITNLQGRVVGFGGRVLDNTNPKYINSPESPFFQKRNLLYNLKSAKETARKKQNLLICEGYMDVITLYQYGIQSIVAPLGTAITEEQLNLAWQYSYKPTIMFDGDSAGLRASYKAAIISLPFLTSKKFLQFILLPNNLDPDNYLNTYSFDKLVKLLKKPIPLVKFIFEHSSNSLTLNNADDKIIFDRYLDDIVIKIKDKKVKYFYKNEFKNLFFNKLKGSNKINNYSSSLPNPSSLIDKQVLSFIAVILNHQTVREDVISLLKNANFLDKKHHNLIKYLENANLTNLNSMQIINNCSDSEYRQILNKSLENQITQLFPFASNKYNSEQAKIDIEDSVKNINTRLLNLKKINKSLETFVSEANSLNWDELQKINQEIQNTEDKD